MKKTPAWISLLVLSFVSSFIKLLAFKEHSTINRCKFNNVPVNYDEEKPKLSEEEIYKKLENKIANTFGKKYGLMVNSGSSANLLAFQCLINPMVKKLKQGDEV